MVHSTYLVIFHLKMIICENFNLLCTYDYHPKKTLICDLIIIKIFTWFTNLFQSYESQCLVNIANFINIKNHFNHFFNMLWNFILAQICFNITSYEIKKCILFCIWFLSVWSTIICKTFMKIFHNNNMVEVQTWNP